ncbi:unnamed protein product [Urochloa humidicola]
MASRLVAATAATAKAATSFPSPAPSLARFISRRGLGRYNPVKVNLWEDPKSPVRWKTSHFVVTSITVWGVCVYGGFKPFGDDEKSKTKVL